MTVEVKIVGECITRTGISDIGLLVAHETDSGVTLRFVSEKLKRVLNAGVDLRVEDLDNFCLAWVKARGLDVHALNGADAGVVD